MTLENRIKEQLSLFADRVSAETMRANQLRMYFAAMAYILLDGLRRLALAGTDMAHAQADDSSSSPQDGRSAANHRPPNLDLDGFEFPRQHIVQHALTALRC